VIFQATKDHQTIILKSDDANSVSSAHIFSGIRSILGRHTIHHHWNDRQLCSDRFLD
jgi:hypothetical protein